MTLAVPAPPRASTTPQPADITPASSTVTIEIQVDEQGHSWCHTPAGDLTWVTHDSDGNPLPEADRHFELNGGELGCVWAANQLRAALDAMVNLADPDRTARRITPADRLAARTVSAGPAGRSYTAMPASAGVAAIATRLLDSTHRTLAGIADEQLHRDDDSCLVWRAHGVVEELTTDDLDDLDELQRRGLVAPDAPLRVTPLGKAVAEFQADVARVAEATTWAVA